MTISYAGIDLPDQPDSLPDEVRDAWPMAPLFWPSAGLVPLGFQAALPPDPPRPGTLYWPAGASRFALLSAVVTQAQLDAIRQAAASSGLYQDLILGDGQRTLVASMRLLPARPLTSIGTGGDCHLLTLADSRYDWWFKSANLTVASDGSTTWSSLFSAIGTALGVTLDVDSIASAYVNPGTSLGAAYQALPVVLDAACLASGLRFQRGFDGTCRCWNYANAAAQQAVNLQTLTNGIDAGGKFALVPGPNLVDLNAIAPASCAVSFLRQDSGVPAPTNPTVYTNTLASLQLSGYGGATGVPNDTKVFRSAAVATWSGGGAPTNDSALSALAKAVATDYYSWLLSSLDQARWGVLDDGEWTPTPLEWLIEVCHGGDGMWSRVRRGPLSDRADELAQYGPAPLPLTVTDGTHTVNQVGQITFSGATVSGTSPDATVTVTGSSDHKVMVSSDDTTPDYLENKLAAGSNITITETTEGGDETLTIAATAGTTGTAAENVSGTASYTLTGGFTDVTGMSITVPASGDYLLWAQVCIDVTAVGIGGVQAKFYDSTAAADITDSERYLYQLQATSSTMTNDNIATNLTCHMQMYVTLVSGHVITLRAKAVNSPTSALVLSNGAGRSTMGYVQLS